MTNNMIQKQMKKTKLLYILYFLLFVWISGTIVAQENTANNNISAKKIMLNGKEYYLHVVQKGEGLFRISMNYGVSQQEILEVNDDITENLKVGQIVRVPVISGRNNSENEINKTRSYIYHTVEKGQTVFYISRKYNVSQDVIYNNNPGSREKLIEGAILKIPVGELHLDNKTDDNEKDDNFDYHTVKPNETLYSLSREYNITVEKIIEANPALQNGILSIGSIVRIPISKQDEKTISRTLNDGTQQFIESDKYLYHTILQGQTFYSIARQYQVKEQDLRDANPGVTQDNLKVGYMLRVPRPEIDDKKIGKTDNSELFTTHKVRRSETLYGISRQHHVDEATLKSLNPNVDFVNLKVGTVLKIPTDAWFAKQTASALQKPEVIISESENTNYDITQSFLKDCKNSSLGYHIPIKVALMLPFSAKDAFSIYNDSVTSTNESQNANFRRAKPYMEFYSGTLLAIDELKKQGANINLKVYDIADSRSLQNAFNDHELKEMDLIIGPGVVNNLNMISAFSLENRINMVYPMSNNNPELRKNPYLFQVNSPDSLYFDLIIEEIIHQARGQNLLVISPKSSETKAVNFAKSLKQRVFVQSRIGSESVKYLEYTPGKDDVLGIQTLIDVEKHTYIVIPSENQAEVSKLIPVIAGVKSKMKANITLFGMPEWLRFQTIDPEEIHIVNGTIFSPFAIDYNDYSTKQFIDKFHQMIHLEPYPVHPYFQNPDAVYSYSRYGIWGYDVTLYFLSALYKYGKNFIACLEYPPSQQIQFNFNFKRISNWGGFYNSGLYMIRFNSDYTTERIPVSPR